MGTKICRICKELKPLSHFSVNRSKSDGKHYNCKPCDSAKAVEWAKNNPEKNAKRIKKYRDQNRERLIREDRNRYWGDKARHLEARKAYYEKNKNKVLTRVLAWASENKDKTRSYVRSHYQKSKSAYLARTSVRRAKKIKATPVWLSAIDLALVQEMYDIAEARTVQTGMKHHVDHIHPLKGQNFCGLHVPWNLQVITAYENLSKQNKMPVNELHLTWGF